MRCDQSRTYGNWLWHLTACCLALWIVCCAPAFAEKPRYCLKEAGRYERIAERMSIKHGEDGAGYAYLDKAVDAYLCAVKQGHLEAGYPAASLVLSQRSSRDLSNEQIETLLRGAVDKGVVGAMFTLADFYCNDRRKCRQPEKAIPLLAVAASYGHASSAMMLGKLYEYAGGDGLHSIDKAYACYELARRLGHRNGEWMVRELVAKYGMIDTHMTCY